MLNTGVQGPVLLAPHGPSRTHIEPEPGLKLDHVGKRQVNMPPPPPVRLQPAPATNAQHREENRSYSPAAYDLVEHLKLETVFSGNRATHRLNPVSRCQAQCGEETWVRVKFIGQSVLSPSFLEKNRKGGQRVVKVVRKSVPLDYSLEILAMARLSKVCTHTTED